MNGTLRLAGSGNSDPEATSERTHKIDEQTEGEPPPDPALESLLQHIGQAFQIIGVRGYALHCVITPDDYPTVSWGYTVGLGLSDDRREFVTVGLSAGEMMDLIRDTVHQTFGRDILEGQALHIAGRHLQLQEVDPSAWPVTIARIVCKDRPFRLWQIVWPDADGRFSEDRDAYSSITQTLEAVLATEVDAGRSDTRAAVLSPIDADSGTFAGGQPVFAPVAKALVAAGMSTIETSYVLFRASQSAHKSLQLALAHTFDREEFDEILAFADGRDDPTYGEGSGREFLTSVVSHLEGVYLSQQANAERLAKRRRLQLVDLAQDLATDKRLTSAFREALDSGDEAGVGVLIENAASEILERASRAHTRIGRKVKIEQACKVFALMEAKARGAAGHPPADNQAMWCASLVSVLAPHAR